MGRGGGGGQFLTISASGLRPWGTISVSRLCPGGQNLRGTQSAPTPALASGTPKLSSDSETDFIAVL